MKTEAKVLKEWLKCIDTPNQPDSMGIRAFAIGVQTLAVLVFVVAILFDRCFVGWWLVSIVFVAMIVGGMEMIVIIRRQGKARLTYILPHIHVESMRKRLAEIEHC